MRTQPDGNDLARDGLIDILQRDAAKTAHWTGIDRFSEPVIGAMARVPRHLFIPEAPPTTAYANRPQPIGCGQTISQPYMVALMSEVLAIKPGQRVLDVGAGSGYQAAVLAEMGAEVFSVERIPKLAEQAKTNLARAGYDTVYVIAADGCRGWPDHAPFDAVLVAAAATAIPPALVNQLAAGGRMTIPLGAPSGPQMLHVGQKDAKGRFDHNPLLPVAFVPLVCERD